MFQIITNNTTPDIYIKDKQSISIPCFYLTNGTSMTSFAPMFNIESTEENLLDIEEFSYVLSTTPSQYQMFEISINDLEPLDDISSLYINGSKYQNLLEVKDLVINTTQQNITTIEEREST